jgi:hypothetical protein
MRKLYSWHASSSAGGKCDRGLCSNHRGRGFVFLDLFWGENQFCVVGEGYQYMVRGMAHSLPAS